MKVVVAPDSFKGSISAREICASVKKGVLRSFPTASVYEMPLADGGEGTMENLVHATGGYVIQVEVKGPLSQPVTAGIGVLGDHETVVIEMAQASGLPLLQEEERNPLVTTSFGTGELIKRALDLNFRKFILGLGGSATNDAGTGMLKALGMKFYSKNGDELLEGGQALSQLYDFDDSGLDQRIHESSFMVASDVINRLCGPDGASVIFGPQKGASPEQVKELDQALNHFSQVVKRKRNVDMSTIAGGGAAGGMGAALVTFLHAKMKSGIEVVMDAMNFQNVIKDASLVITGEGKLDSQTLSGKVIAGVTKMALPYQIPVIALCGSVQLTYDQMEDLGLLGAFPIVPGPCTMETSMEKASEWICDRTEQVLRFMKKLREADGAETQSIYHEKDT